MTDTLAQNECPRIYATFWQRFVAMIGDIVVLSPLIAVDGWLASHSRELALAIEVPMVAAFSAYTVYGHGRFGQTVGKYLVGIRVVGKSGAAIGWRQAFVRSSVDIGFSVLGLVASLVALATIPDAEYYGVSWMQRMENLGAYNPSWLDWVGTMGQIWIWSEIIVVLFNRDKRALHDFLAGTVVIAESKVSSTAPQRA